MNDIKSRLHTGYDYIMLDDLNPAVIAQLREVLDVKVAIQEVVAIGRKVVEEQESRLVEAAASDDYAAA